MRTWTGEEIMEAAQDLCEIRGVDPKNETKYICGDPIGRYTSTELNDAVNEIETKIKELQVMHVLGI